MWIGDDGPAMMLKKHQFAHTLSIHSVIFLRSVVIIYLFRRCRLLRVWQEAEGGKEHKEAAFVHICVWCNPRVWSGSNPCVLVTGVLRHSLFCQKCKPSDRSVFAVMKALPSQTPWLCVRRNTVVRHKILLKPLQPTRNFLFFQDKFSFLFSSV